MYRRILAPVLSCFLTASAAPAAGSSAAVIGVVTQCNAAHVGSTAVSPGTTAYDGDRFSTESDGALLLRSAGASVRLLSYSEITLRGTAAALQVELSRGVLVFSTVKASGVQVSVLSAQIFPAGDGPTIAQVSILSPRLLELFARQGSLRFSYRNEPQILPEGSRIRVLLDPSSKERAAASESGKNNNIRRPPHAYILITVTAVALPTAIAIHEALESPDRP